MLKIFTNALLSRNSCHDCQWGAFTHFFLFGWKTKSPNSAENVQGDILFGEIPNNDHWFSRILGPKWINVFLGQECHDWALKLYQNESWSMWKDENKKK